MTIMRVERVVYGVPDLEECARFFSDFGLEHVDYDGPGERFETRTGKLSTGGR
jgi:catechol 2,3-dioxygenase-like lactoylglutathione lyase family enzyme